jgi:hypothetical protein
MIKIIMLIGLFALGSCAGDSGRSAAQICTAASDSRCVGEHVGSECTQNRSHTCIKTGGGTLTPVCDCLDSQGGPVPDDFDELNTESFESR